MLCLPNGEIPLFIFYLGVSAGVMIYISMVEIFAEARLAAVNVWGSWGMWAATGAFFAGMMLIAVIDMLVPSMKTPMNRAP